MMRKKKIKFNAAMKTAEEKFKSCGRGHIYRGSGPCPVCRPGNKKEDISGGTAHKVPADLRNALTSDPKALSAWESLTPLSRNEWICWTISVQKPETRSKHVARVCSELKEGIRRPCCWIGCVHRADKAISASVGWVLDKRSKSE